MRVSDPVLFPLSFPLLVPPSFYGGVNLDSLDLIISSSSQGKRGRGMRGRERERERASRSQPTYRLPNSVLILAAFAFFGRVQNKTEFGPI